MVLHTRKDASFFCDSRNAMDPKLCLAFIISRQGAKVLYQEQIHFSRNICFTDITSASSCRALMRIAPIAKMLF